MKIKFLELGKQPIANNFIDINSRNQEKEFFFDLNVTFDTNNFLVSLENFVQPELMFNESYVYHSSQSQTMREHFKNAANKFKSNFKVDKVFVTYDQYDSEYKKLIAEITKMTNDLGLNVKDVKQVQIAKKLFDELDNKATQLDMSMSDLTRYFTN